MARPHFFRSPAAWRDWLAANHASAREVLVGCWKKGTGKPTLTWPESVDEALCFGWIDGVRKSIDDERYQIRSTPRKRTSHWSRVNVARVAALREGGRMTPAGEAAFAARSSERTGRAAYELPEATLAPADEAQFKKDKIAWAAFRAMAPSYQRTAIRWIVSAKRDETRARRLAELMEASERGERPSRWKYAT